MQTGLALKHKRQQQNSMTARCSVIPEWLHLLLAAIAKHSKMKHVFRLSQQKKIFKNVCVDLVFSVVLLVLCHTEQCLSASYTKFLLLLPC